VNFACQPKSLGRREVDGDHELRRSLPMPPTSQGRVKMIEQCHLSISNWRREVKAHVLLTPASSTLVRESNVDFGARLMDRLTQRYFPALITLTYLRRNLSSVSDTALAHISYPLVDGCNPSTMISRGILPSASRNAWPMSM
jgi:hypothetical protein